VDTAKAGIPFPRAQLEGGGNPCEGAVVRATREKPTCLGPEAEEEQRRPWGLSVQGSKLLSGGPAVRKPTSTLARTKR
jgi:hypothetical protein